MREAHDQWDSIPQEMRWSRQWCVAGPDKAPYGVSGRGLYAAKVTDPNNWSDFETVVDAATAHGGGIGFVLCESDSFTCIDLDVIDAETQAAKGEPINPAKWTTPEQFNRYWSIVQHFDSYTERSRSGKGLHIWVRGKIGKGCRRDGVEVYSKERFMICTGDIVLNKPISERQDLLNVLVAEMQRAQGAEAAGQLVEVAATLSDAEVWERARGAANDHKFIPLCEGRWHELGYPSQSEADLSLMSMFCFYSESNEQCRRMFRQTALGVRDKAVKNDRYLNDTLKKIRGRQAREAVSAAHGEGLALALLSQVRGASAVDALVGSLQASNTQAKVLAQTVPQPPPAAVKMATLAPQRAINDGGLPWPPGLAGAIAGFIYQSAPRPVKEVAIVATLGLLAGICGKAFGIPQSGLNLYIILVARSAVGKEAMHSGIAAILESLRNSEPSAMQFVDFSDFASGPALSKAVAINPSFVNVSGEWGRKLKRLADDFRVDGPMQQLRTVMTNLYQKSGKQSIVGGISYSQSADNVGSVNGVAYSMIGETTPNTLYEALTENMMEDGFMSRFTIIEYAGERPPHNYKAIETPDAALAGALAGLAYHCRDLINRNHQHEVGRNAESAQLLHDFDLRCDAEINSTTDESHRQMWNRAALKVMRISALLAVADNYVHPVIEAHHVTWALDVVMRDIGIMKRRMEDGDVGLNDTSRERKLLSVCRDFLRNNIAKSYNVPEAMHKQGIIPRQYLQIKIQKQASFTQHKLGSTAALDQCLRSLVDSGYLMELDKAKQVEAFGFHGKSYRILNLPNL